MAGQAVHKEMIRITAAEGVRIRNLIDEDVIHPECTMRGHLPSIEIRAGRERNERYKIGEEGNRAGRAGNFPIWTDRTSSGPPSPRDCGESEDNSGGRTRKGDGKGST